MKLNQLKDKKILILGLGQEGWSSYRFLRRYFKQQKIWIADRKTLKEFETSYKKILQQDKNLVLNLGSKYLNKLTEVDIIIKTPGIKLDEKLIKKLAKKNIIITSNLNIFLANLKGKIIGVTGSKGKGTTTTLIYKILKAGGKKTYLIGNIGKPFLNYLKNDSTKTIYVAELSSFHLENAIGKFDIGVFISFFPEHLKEHGNLNNYFRAKMNLVQNIKDKGYLIYNAEDKKINQAIKKIKIKKIGYHLPKTKISTPLLGQHNQLNIQAAIEVAKLFKMKPTIIFKTIKNFKGLPYRLELIGKFNGIKFYSDTLGTTPEATVKAIEALQEVNLQTLIVGGVSKGGNYNLVARAIVKAKLKNLIMLPHVGIEIGKLIKKNKNGDKPNLIVANNMHQAVKQAFKLTQTGESVCLSPAGTSFDFYKNYAEKGEDFKKWVKKYK